MGARRVLLRRYLEVGSDFPRSTFADCTDALLLDTAVKGSHSGGTGAAFDWQAS